jgi:hypothetical protein
MIDLLSELLMDLISKKKKGVCMHDRFAKPDVNAGSIGK